MNSRPACALSMRSSTCVPKYGAGLGLRLVAWISCKSRVGADVEPVPPADSVTEDMGDPFSYEILSRNSSTAAPTFPRRRVSATVRFGLATYQASAVIWCLTIHSLMVGW